MTWSSYGTFLIFAVLVVLAPGPDTMVMLKNALSGGTRGGLLATAGITVGNLVQGIAVGFGLGALIIRSQPLFVTLRWAGVAYLCYLGFQALRAAYRGDYRVIDEMGSRASGFRRWREGFLSNTTNPKVLALYLSVLPQFLDPIRSTTGDALLLAFTVAALGGFWLLALMLVVHRVRLMLRRRRVRRSLDALTGTALIGFGVALAVD